MLKYIVKWGRIKDMEQVVNLSDAEIAADFKVVLATHMLTLVRLANQTRTAPMIVTPLLYCCFHAAMIVTPLLYCCFHADC